MNARHKVICGCGKFNPTFGELFHHVEDLVNVKEPVDPVVVHARCVPYAPRLLQMAGTLFGGDG